MNEYFSKQTKKQMIIFIAKYLVVIGFLYFLAHKGFLSIQALAGAILQWKLILPAVFVFFSAIFLGVIRWQWLLQAHHIHLGWYRIMQLTLIGHFFNVALPGAVSGDFIKAFYIRKELQGKGMNALGSIVFDRVIGLSALILLSASSCFLGFNSILHGPFLVTIQQLIIVSAAIVVVFYLYLFLVTEHTDPFLRILKYFETLSQRMNLFVRIYESLRHYHRYRWLVMKVLCLSVLIHLLIGWGCFNFAKALGATDLSLLSVYLVVPLGLLLLAVPIAPAGIGTGNIAFFYLFQLIGFDRGADVFSLIALTNLMIGMMGGWVYFRFRVQSVPS